MLIQTTPLHSLERSLANPFPPKTPRAGLGSPPVYLSPGSAPSTHLCSVTSWSPWPARGEQVPSSARERLSQGAEFPGELRPAEISPRWRPRQSMGEAA